MLLMPGSGLIAHADGIFARRLSSADASPRHCKAGMDDVKKFARRGFAAPAWCDACVSRADEWQIRVLWTRAKARDLLFWGSAEASPHARGFTPLALSVEYFKQDDAGGQEEDFGRRGGSKLLAGAGN
jgi:hypothetical protein